MYQKNLRYVVIQFELTMMDELMKQQINGHVSEIKIHITISTRFSNHITLLIYWHQTIT